MSDADARDRERRRSRRLRRLIIYGFIGAVIVCAAGPGRRLRTTSAEVRLPGLPAPAEGLRIAFLSDFHLGPWVGRRQVSRSVEMANSLRPDLIILGGDYISHRRKYIAPCARVLGRLRAPMGVYAVLGNHDHWVDAPATTRALEQVGIHILTNRGEEISPGLYLAGIDDWWARPDLERAFAGAGKGDCVILVSHNPDAILDRRARRADLILSGHTHGGQVAVVGPLLVASEYGRRHPRGLHRVDDSQIYITTGVGNGFPPLRLFCRPEVALITLRRARGD